MDTLQLLQELQEVNEALDTLRYRYISTDDYREKRRIRKIIVEIQGHLREIQDYIYV